MVNVSFMLQWLSLLWSKADPTSTEPPVALSRRCRGMTAKDGFSLSISTTYVAAGSNITLPPAGQGCPPHETFTVPVDLCRVEIVRHTTNTSTIRGEAWLPDEWYGRILGLGNSGLGGCKWLYSGPILPILRAWPGVDYRGLSYGASMHFATIATDAGHSGDLGITFSNLQVLRDYSYRGLLHASGILKSVVEYYYSRPHSKAYYLGCSTGGRQGIHSALYNPSARDWDGIVVGAPAIDLHNLLGSSALLARDVGEPGDDSWLEDDAWDLVSREIIRQCGDGSEDGVIEDPDACELDLRPLKCKPGQKSPACLTGAQLFTVQRVFEPTMSENWEEMYPRIDPGSERDSEDRKQRFTGTIFPYAKVQY